MRKAGWLLVVRRVVSTGKTAAMLTLQTMTQTAWLHANRQAVLSERPSDMEARPESPHTRAMADVEPLHGNPTAASVVATPDHALLENGEYCLRKPLREICTVGSVRGETSVGHGGPKRARSRKRWKEAKASLQPTKSPLPGRATITLASQMVLTHSFKVASGTS